MKVFISGPYDEKREIHRLDKLARFFEQSGHEVVKEINVPFPNFDDDDITKLINNSDKSDDQIHWMILSMRQIWEMSQCDALILMEGWKDCHISMMLFAAAKKLEMRVYWDDGSEIGLPQEAQIKSWFERQIKG